MIMGKITKEDRYVKDKNSLLKECPKYYNGVFKSAEYEIKRSPTPPPRDDDWKILERFESKSEYPRGVMCSYRISHWDRIVYDLNLENGDITFTNCKGHKCRDEDFSTNNSLGGTRTLSYNYKYYSDSHPDATKLMLEAIYNPKIMDQLEEDIDIAMEDGYFETEDYEIECNEYGIFIHDKIYNEITYASIDINRFALSPV